MLTVGYVLSETVWSSRWNRDATVFLMEQFCPWDYHELVVREGVEITEHSEPYLRKLNHKLSFWCREGKTSIHWKPLNSTFCQLKHLQLPDWVTLQTHFLLKVQDLQRDLSCIYLAILKWETMLGSLCGFLSRFNVLISCWVFLHAWLELLWWCFHTSCTSFVFPLRIMVVSVFRNLFLVIPHMVIF